MSIRNNIDEISKEIKELEGSTPDKKAEFVKLEGLIEDKKATKKNCAVSKNDRTITVNKDKNYSTLEETVHEVTHALVG